MPKGVEHHGRFGEVTAKLNEAISSVMPKGVEHQNAAGAYGNQAAAISSVMSKGVEHFPEIVALVAP